MPRLSGICGHNCACRPSWHVCTREEGARSSAPRHSQSLPSLIQMLSHILSWALSLQAQYSRIHSFCSALSGRRGPHGQDSSSPEHAAAEAARPLQSTGVQEPFHALGGQSDYMYTRKAWDCTGLLAWPAACCRWAKLGPYPRFDLVTVSPLVVAFHHLGSLLGCPQDHANFMWASVVLAAADRQGAQCR